MDTSSHVWLDLVDSQHPDFTTVAQLDTTSAVVVEGEGKYVIICCCSVVCVLAWLHGAIPASFAPVSYIYSVCV